MTMPVMTLIEAIRHGLTQEMELNPRTLVLGEDVGVRGGVFGATRGLLERFGPERVIDMPLAESSIVGVAIGAAVAGWRPLAEIQFADYIHPAMNQIINEAARIRYRTNGDYTCPVVIRAPFGGGVHGALYHSQSVEGLFYHVPGLKIVIPSTPYDARGLLRAAMEQEDPVLFFEHKRAYRLMKGEVPEEPYSVPIGPAAIRREGRHCTVIAYGLMVHHALEAAERLSREEGIEAEVIDLRTILPLDRETLIASAQKTGRVLIVHEDNRTGGVGAEVAAILAEEALFYLDAPIRRHTGPDAPAMPFNPVQEAAFLPNPYTIADQIRELVRF